ncbi:MAG: twin-arginine translocation signal domain-containing protein [Planctomycetes bacterium]|nr:twin-arginine translocation signal domain-containing protein [Planctomycetota bacterium]
MERREFLKAIALGAGALYLGGAKVFAQDQNRGQSNGGGGKVLVAYFSKTGNTRSVAEFIHGEVGGDLFNIAPATPYPESYQETIDIARREQSEDARPPLAATVSGMETYSTVYLGYPNWWGTLPMAVFTFLEQYDFSGKTILPFCTHEGSGLGRGPGDIQRVCPQATVTNGLAIRGGAAASSQREVAAWVQQASGR